ncbi:MAG: hypothetical protein KBB88_01035 [Candidatus Pacebacteria bacterium]|nr:hypothetical protein [Candidatus Paceibacterota bacterium]
MKRIAPLIIIVIVFISCALSASMVFAADARVTLDKSTVEENQTFTVTIFTDTKGVSINNIEGNLSFPNHLVSVESVSTSSSIFSLWVEQPTFSNANGTISFNGGIPTPGYNGSNGKVISIVFKAKKAGVAQLAFYSLNIYANDGLGTNVTSLSSGNSITITAHQIPETETVVSGDLPPLPIVSSIDSQDLERWYTLHSALFSWNVPTQVTSVQLSFNTSSESTPTVTYTPPINQKEITDIQDGVHYFHVRYQNAFGWGKIAHRKIMVDKTAPSRVHFESSITPNSLMSLNILSEDKTSGVSTYTISVDGVLAVEIPAENGSTTIVLPPLPQGEHTVSVTAYDRAGNHTEYADTLSFPKIKTPTILAYPESITKGESIAIEGTSYPDTDVRIWIQYENEEAKSYSVRALHDATFSFTSEPIGKDGLVSLWVENIIGGQIAGESSQKYFVIVEKTAVAKASMWATQVLSLAIPVLILLLVLIYLALHGYYRIHRLRKRLKLDLADTNAGTHKGFRILAEDAKNITRIFDRQEIKSKLQKEDTETIELLTKDIEEAEKYFLARLKSIEKEDL